MRCVWLAVATLAMANPAGADAEMSGAKQPEHCRKSGRSA